MSYASSTPLSQQITLQGLKEIKSAAEKFTCLSLYDATMAALAQDCGVETLLVGDSLGMTIQGRKDTLPVTMEHMLYHTEAVARGNQQALLMVDLPFMAYAQVAQALTNAARLLQAGAHMVKLEGGRWLADTVGLLSERGIPVCAHLGLTPQSVNKLGGFRVQGRDAAQAAQMLEDAKILEAAGADLLLLECVPAALANTITAALTIPTIGIGAGAGTDAQVLVINDILGITPQPPKFAKDFLAEHPSIRAAIGGFVQAVKSGQFPQAEHSFF
ncbi:MAG: 3-methyl-2-oxobutanoate hydroxymethyltransferase [Cellvibrionaceae bacterium]|nr:3-methyl-2-oxobutanoate hydroxymethyltransferase [Cellvibrionaceae bacterium]